MPFESILARPRAYIDWAVPKDADGNDIGVCTEEASFHGYLEWLADYLFKANIPVPEFRESFWTTTGKRVVLSMRFGICQTAWDTPPGRLNASKKCRPPASLSQNVTMTN